MFSNIVNEYNHNKPSRPVAEAQALWYSLSAPGLYWHEESGLPPWLSRSGGWEFELSQYKGAVAQQHLGSGSWQLYCPLTTTSEPVVGRLEELASHLPPSHFLLKKKKKSSSCSGLGAPNTAFPPWHTQDKTATASEFWKLQISFLSKVMATQGTCPWSFGVLQNLDP